MTPTGIIRVLLVEDDPGDRLLVEERLGEGHGGVHVQRASRLADALVAMDAPAPPDVVLLDLGLPDSDGLDGLEALLGAHPHVPVVVLTGADDDLLADSALALGAQDYVVKGAELRLDRVLRNAIERQTMRLTLEQTLRERSALVRLGQLAIEGGDSSELSQQLVALVAEALRASHVELIEEAGDGVFAVVGTTGDVSAPPRCPTALALAALDTRGPVIAGDGSTTSMVAVPVPDSRRVLAVLDGRPDPFTDAEQHFLVAIAGAAGEVQRRRHAERERAEAQQRLQGLFDHTQDAILLFDGDDRYVDANPAAVRLFGRSARGDRRPGHRGPGRAWPPARDDAPAGDARRYGTLPWRR